MKRIVALTILVFMLMLSVILDRGIVGLMAFWNAPSLMIVSVITISMLVVSDSFTDFFRGFNIVMTDKSYTTKELKASLNAVDTAIKLMYLSGVIGTVTGLVNMLGSLDDPSAIGPAVAIAFLTVFYAVIINLFLYGTKAKIKKELIYRKK